ncbi:C-X-C motif chemokine 9-like [Hemibagrus wyckioides]|uniref:C-X-C motif chemokine 9-like n=1 Tax=Hemibagrus wyckioides TaxID=337641 RepID=UPI00266CFA04|nr:C-X-C motif chemokine 9-like [Hemibagrus wyckioides]XP_058230350.1 C-X-C motif chemokine 9-like [Hemibagrus wyckioides]
MKAATLPLLFFIIFALTAMVCEGLIQGKAQRCFCQKNTQERVKPALVKTLEIFPPSASCAKTEIILTLKKGRQVCLNPDGSQGQKFLTGKKQKNKSKEQQGKKQMKNKPQN